MQCIPKDLATENGAKALISRSNKGIAVSGESYQVRLKILGKISCPDFV